MEDEVLGKAYDARLMRRLLTYLHPYRRQVVLAIAALVAHSVLELVPPFLTKLVIDEYIPAADLSALSGIAALFLLTLWGSFAFEYLQTATMQTIGQRITVALMCPVCRDEQRLGTGPVRCTSCGTLLTVELEEPRCECGYLLYQLQTEACPECGRAIAPEQRGCRGDAARSAAILGDLPSVSSGGPDRSRPSEPARE